METNYVDEMLVQATTLIKASRDCLQDLTDLLAPAADAIEKGSEHEGQCASCGMSPFHLDGVPPGEHHAPDCIVREIRALLGGLTDPSPDKPLYFDASEVTARLQGTETDGAARACDCPWCGVSLPTLEELRRDAVPVFAEHAVSEPDVNLLEAIRFRLRFRPPHAPPAETFAVIRWGKRVLGFMSEVEWDQMVKDDAWSPVCRGIPSEDLAREMVQTLSSRPFSESQVEPAKWADVFPGVTPPGKE